MLYDDLRHQLVQARKAARLSQAQVLKRLDLSKAGFSAWENGRNQPRIDDLALWASAVRLRLEVVLRPAREREEEEQARTARAILDDLGEADLRLLNTIATLLPRLGIADRRTLQLLVDGWSQSSDAAAEATPASPAQRRSRVGG